MTEESFHPGTFLNNQKTIKRDVRREPNGKQEARGYKIRCELLKGRNWLSIGQRRGQLINLDFLESHMCS